MSVLASIRPDSWNLPLFLHVLGAMVLVGSAATGALAELLAVGSGEPERMRRLGFRSLLFAALPAYIVMRVAAEWMYSKEFGDTDADPAWIGIGYITADIGALLLLVTLIMAGIASRKSKPGLGKAAGIIAAVLVVAWLVAVWAMGGKPG